MSRTLFRVNSRVTWISRKSLFQAGKKSEVQVTVTGVAHKMTWLVNEHSTIWPNNQNDWTLSWLFICTVPLTVCYCHVTYVFKSESALYSFLNVEELLALIRRKIWSLINCNWAQAYNHLARKPRYNHFANVTKWLSSVLRTYIDDSFESMYFSCHVHISEWSHTL